MQRIKDTWKNVSWTYSNVPDLSGRVFIVTGSNSGIGYAAIKHLADHHAYCIMATRNGDRAVDAIQSIRGRDGVTNGTIKYMHLDLASLSSIKSFASEFKATGLPLHGLVCNAGVMVPEQEATEDGMEIDTGVNFFGHFYLAHLLLDVLKTSAPSRLIFMSSPEEARGFLPWHDITGSHDPYRDHKAVEWYGTANLCKLMAGREMNDRLKATAQLSPLPEVFIVQPGMTSTDLFRKMDFEKRETSMHDWAQKLGGQNIEWGAKSTVYAATEPSLAGQGGSYYGPLYAKLAVLNVFNCMKQEPSNKLARDREARSRLYEVAADALEKLTGEKLPHRLPPVSASRAEM